MTPEQKVAFINAQVVGAQIERVAMLTQNIEDLMAKRLPSYKFTDFMALQDKYVIGHNAVISYFAE